jgi:phosphonopyruvate decarboxylase
MIHASDFIAAAKKDGFDFFTGVPCSFLTPLINGVLNDRSLSYVGAASEGEAVAIAAGAWVAGRKTVVMCQNSGLGNAVNPLTSLNAPFRIPTLFVTTWRGQPGLPDEPQHEVMGVITPDLLTLMGLEHSLFPDRLETVAPSLDQASRRMEATSLPFAMILQKDSVAEQGLDPQAPLARVPGQRRDFAPEGEMPARAAVLQAFLSIVDPTAAVVATTGKCGRELFTLDDRRQHIYQVGSMGGASAMALGVALNTERQVVVLDGDGAFLMKMGNLATIGAYRPANLIHIVLDNGVHDSTGGQATVSAGIDMAGVALACGYAFAASCSAIADFTEAYQQAQAAGGPAFIHVRIAPGSMGKLGRPTVKPPEVARRFKDFLAEGAAR